MCLTGSTVNVHHHHRLILSLISAILADFGFPSLTLLQRQPNYFVHDLLVQYKMTRGKKKWWILRCHWLVLPVLWYGSCASGRPPPSRPLPAHEGNPRPAASTDETQRARDICAVCLLLYFSSLFFLLPSTISVSPCFRLVLHRSTGGQVFVDPSAGNSLQRRTADTKFCIAIGVTGSYWETIQFMSFSLEGVKLIIQFQKHWCLHFP